MDSRTIALAIKTDPETSRYFLGALPYDLAPPLTNFPCSMILNTDPLGAPGKHWVALFFDKSRHCEYFDSLGMLPHENILKYIKIYANSFNCNDKIIQSFYTPTCGQFCMFYLFWRSRGVPMKDIAGKLIYDKQADETIDKFVKTVFHIQ